MAATVKPELKRKVLFRSDGNSKIGLGHIHRCISLAENIHQEFQCTFAIRNPLPGIKKLIAAYGFNVVEMPPDDFKKEPGRIASLDYDIIVLDGYSFDTSYQRILVDAGKKVVCIDDLYAFHFTAHVVINPAGNITRDRYQAEAYTRFYLGSEYCLVKKEFRRKAADRTPSDKRENAVFVCIGGADTHRNETLAILQACEVKAPPNWHFYVVLGEAYPHHAVIEEFVRRSALTITILKNLSPTEMADYMGRSRAAICPPSGLAYEYLFVGGILYLYQVAENQSDTLSYLLDSHLAFQFSEFPTTNEVAIRMVLENQKKAFDGQSEVRFLKVFKGLL